jgi:fermentation-respiration switch protein FrsA (DUF1100 family)
MRDKFEFLRTLHKNPTMIKLIIYALRTFMILLILYLMFGILMLSFQSNFLYHPDGNNNFEECSGFDEYEKITINGTRFYYKNLEFSDTVLVYYSGNGGSACDRSGLRNYYEGYQASTLFVEYSGYSDDRREPSIELLQQDVHNVAKFIKNKTKVYVVGESLGTGVASYHAYSYEVNILLLLAPFYSTKDLGVEKFPYYPISFLEIENYNSAYWLSNFDGRLVMLHGELDSNIPYTQSQKLFDSLAIVDKHLFVFPFAKHNDLYNYFDTQRVIRYTFLNRTYSNRLEEYRYD